MLFRVISRGSGSGESIRQTSFDIYGGKYTEGAGDDFEEGDDNGVLLLNDCFMTRVIRIIRDYIQRGSKGIVELLQRLCVSKRSAAEVIRSGTFVDW